MFVYTDGGCAPSNPGPGSWAFVVREGDFSRSPLCRTIYEACGFEPESTNQRMEITAVARGLEYAARELPELGCVEIITDSRYITGTLNDGWKRRVNGDLWGELFKWKAALRERDCEVSFTWIKGHADLHDGNIRADVLCWEAREHRSTRFEILS